MKHYGYSDGHLWYKDVLQSDTKIWQKTFIKSNDEEQPGDDWIFIGYELSYSDGISGMVYRDRRNAGVNAKELWVKVEQPPVILAPSIQEQIDNLNMRIEALENRSRGRRQLAQGSEFRAFMGQRFRVTDIKLDTTTGKLTLEADRVK